MPAVPVPPALLRRRETIAESMRPPTFKYLTATERDQILKRLELVDMLIRDHGVIDHAAHEWCDAREGCGTSL
ncbi:MAG: hypothetical protein ABWY37_10395 [Microbacterium pygmaeum]